MQSNRVKLVVEVFLGLGSNVQPQKHIALGLDELQQRFGPLLVSSVYESEAVGFEGDNFLNLVAQMQTNMPLQELVACLKAIEVDYGRLEGQVKYSPRALDIDVLTYGEQVGQFANTLLPREEVLTNAFVLRPLAELAPDSRHPVNGRTYAELWQSLDHNQKLWPVDYIWRGRRISRA